MSTTLDACADGCSETRRGGPIATLAAMAARWREHRDLRRTTAAMRALPDWMLRDIGIGRSGIDFPSATTPDGDRDPATSCCELPQQTRRPLHRRRETRRGAVAGRAVPDACDCGGSVQRRGIVAR